jgi:putative transposase
MLALISTGFSWLACRFRSRAELELELIALHHQIAILNRQRPRRPRFCSIDRLLWVWLYRVWPRCLELMVVAKPATVVQWHRQGFRFYWRCRSRSGRRPVDCETRKLVREMCFANPLWGAPRIHGELLKLGIKVSQATVAKCMVRRSHRPSPTWRSFLHNQALGITAIDMCSSSHRPVATENSMARKTGVDEGAWRAPAKPTDHWQEGKGATDFLLLASRQRGHRSQ